MVCSSCTLFVCLSFILIFLMSLVNYKFYLSSATSALVMESMLGISHQLIKEGYITHILPVVMSNPKNHRCLQQKYHKLLFLSMIDEYFAN